MQWVGLDIGGANIKACLNESDVISVEFPLWKHPAGLDAQLNMILQRAPEEFSLAVTMTGELADCFPSRSAGVEFIVSSVLRQSRARTTVFYTTDGKWVESEVARNDWIRVAASNWHAIASYVGKFLDEGNGFLVDVGSTTVDIIPIRNGQPATTGMTDDARLTSGELCYAGVQRTPVCSILSEFDLDGRHIDIARELFASMQDVFLLLGDVNEENKNCNTADGRPATIEFAAQRLSRMICVDAAELSRASLIDFALQADSGLRDVVARSLSRVVAANSDLPLEFIICGQGEWFAERVLKGQFGDSRLLLKKLSDLQTPQVSKSAAAFSVAQLAGNEIVRLIGKAHYNQTSNCDPVRVIKVGGSLLSWQHSRNQIKKWLAKQPDMRNVWLAGGGEMVDSVRDWNLETPLDERQAHWICIDIMSITTRMLKGWFPSWQVTDQLESLLPPEFSENVLFDPAHWLRLTPGLPESWQVTSDSCAAFLANHIQAQELVLLKSCGTAPSDFDSLFAAGIVDEFFPAIANEIPSVRFVNIRDDHLAETSFQSGDLLARANPMDLNS